MAQTCDAFEGSSIPSDVLIGPLVKTSELLSRANDHFSYSDIDNAEVRGEILLSMSTNSFLAELQHIKDSTSYITLLRGNSKSWKRASSCIANANDLCSNSNANAIISRRSHQ
jgi:hypothetical protein